MFFKHTCRSRQEAMFRLVHAVSPASRWAQRLGGMDFLPLPSLDSVAANGEGDAAAAAASGAVLAGLAEHRQQQRAQKFIDDLKAALQAVSPKQ